MEQCKPKAVEMDLFLGLKVVGTVKSRPKAVDMEQCKPKAVEMDLFSGLKVVGTFKS